MIKILQNSMVAWRLRKLYRQLKKVLSHIFENYLLRQHVSEQKKKFRENLILLHDVLEESTFSDHYWIWGGMLIGWARDGKLLEHDYDDADFAYFAEDREKFLASVDRIIQAGFQPSIKWVNNDGLITEYTFAKDGAKFEFWEMQRKKDEIWFYTYAPELALQTSNAIPVHQLEPMELLGRRWLKPDDHDAHLTAIYGNWREPDPSWDYLEDDRSIRERTRWTKGQSQKGLWATIRGPAKSFA